MGINEETIELSPGPVEGSSHNIHLQKRQLSRLLRRADTITDKVERWNLLQRAREIARDLRTPYRGYSVWGPLVVCACLAIVAIAWLSSGTRNTYFYSYPGNYLRVVQNVDPCLPDGSCGHRFVMQNVSDGVAGPETEMHFCQGLQPRFEAGHSLSWIRYTNLGSCQAIDGYDILRRNGAPVYAPNCTPDFSLAPVAGHFICEGGRAKFE